MSFEMTRIVLSLGIFLSVIPSFAQTMEWHIKDNYADIKYLGNNLFKVQNSNGKWGIVNEYGETTVEIKYDSITPIVDNRALILDITGQYLKGIVNEDGKIIKSFYNNERIANYQYYSEGLLAYGVVSGGYYLFGYLDVNGNTQIKPKYFWTAPFRNGKAVVQYKSKNYGLINSAGGIAVNDNRKFKFMSTPIDNCLLVVVGSSRGEKVLLVELTPNGKFNEIQELENGTIIKGSANYKSFSCQNGHIYYFDDAMRLINSSVGKHFNKPLIKKSVLPNNSSFKKVREHDGWRILYSDNVVFHSSFKDIAFCNDEYVIITSNRNTKGVLRLNNTGNVTIQDIPARAEFYHNEMVTGNLAVNINDLLPNSQVQIGITGIKENNQEEKFNVPVGCNGIYNQPISYFIPATTFDSEVILPIKINIYIDGMLYKTETKNLTGIHKKAFKVSHAISPEFSESNGKATITFNVQSLESVPSSTAEVIVSGASYQKKRFNGKESVSFKMDVSVPASSVKTYTLKVTVNEEGCPSFTKNISTTIKHYNLQ